MRERIQVGAHIGEYTITGYNEEQRNIRYEATHDLCGQKVLKRSNNFNLGHHGCNPKATYKVGPQVWSQDASLWQRIKNHFKK